MTRRAALITQAEVARAIRAAKQEGASAIEVKPDGSIFVHLVPNSTKVTGAKDGTLADRREVVL